MGAFTRTMAEADAELLGAARVFADTRAGVVAKGGEVAQAIAAGVFASAAIEHDHIGLVRRAAPVPRRPEDVTVFKSVGSAAFDLVAAELILRE
jgi:ornithine cyclodeaminase